MVKIAARSVVELLHQAGSATLATHSTQTPGYPYATVLPYALDERHRPLLLVSLLAEHTRNLLADARCSLSVAEPGVADVQAHARLTLLADAEQVALTQAETARLSRYLPAAPDLLQLDFIVMRLNPLRARYIGGVGRMGWVEGAELAALPPMEAERESALLAEMAGKIPQEVTVLGLDAWGADYVTAGAPGRSRFWWPEGRSEQDMAAALISGLAV